MIIRMKKAKEALPALKAAGKGIVTEEGQPVRLRGVSLNSWLTPDSGLHGLPGSSQMLRLMMEEQAGREKASALFRGMEDSFVMEKDIAFLSGLGANVVWAPLDYRRFFQDGLPIRLEEEALQRLDSLLEWCENYQLYCIPELQAAPGGQNALRESGMGGRQALLFEDGGYQEMLIAFWETLARRYKGRTVIAAFDLLCKPNTADRFGRFHIERPMDSQLLSDLYTRIAAAISGIDPERILIFDGDASAQGISGIPAETVASSACAISLIAGEELAFYPGLDAQGKYQDKKRIQDSVRQSLAYCETLGMPLFVRVSAPRGYAQILRDKLDVLEEHQASWALNEYKDWGCRGLVRYAPDCPYIRTFGDVLMRWGYQGNAFYGKPVTGLRQKMRARLKEFETAMGEASGNERLLDGGAMLEDWVDDLYYAKILAFEFAGRAANMSSSELQALLAGSFALQACVQSPLVSEVAAYWQQRA